MFAGDFNFFVGNKSLDDGLEMSNTESCEFSFYFKPTITYDSWRMIECIRGPLTGQYLYLYSLERSRQKIRQAGPALENGGIPILRRKFLIKCSRTAAEIASENK